MRFGCSSLLYGGYDLPAALEGIHEAGYEALELCAIPGMGEHLLAGGGDDYYAEVRRQVTDNGLVLEAVGGGALLDTERFEPLLRAAAAVGAPCVTLNSGGVSDDAAAWEEMRTLFGAALPLCQALGVRLAVKPHVRQGVYNTATARRFMEELDSPWVGLNLDNTHLHRAGECPLTAVRELQPWILTARVRDYKSSDLSVGPLENQIPGKGQADLKGYLEALSQVPGLEFVTVEMVGAKDLALAEVRRVVGEALVALRSYL